MDNVYLSPTKNSTWIVELKPLTFHLNVNKYLKIATKTQKEHP